MIWLSCWNPLTEWPQILCLESTNQMSLSMDMLHSGNFISHLLFLLLPIVSLDLSTNLGVGIWCHLLCCEGLELALQFYSFWLKQKSWYFRVIEFEFKLEAFPSFTSLVTVYLWSIITCNCDGVNCSLHLLWEHYLHCLLETGGVMPLQAFLRKMLGGD